MRYHPPVRAHSPDLAGVVERNIDALHHRRRSDERRRGLEERIAAGITTFAGSMRFVYIHAVLFGAWVLINVGWLPGPRVGPSFVILAMFALVGAIFPSTFVLITQNRMARLADERAALDVQVSLLAEHETTRRIQLTSAIVARLGIEEASDPELSELKQDAAPEKVLDALESSERRVLGDP